MLPGAVDWRIAQLIGGKVFAFPGTGKLDVRDAVGFHCHGEDGHRIAWRLAARNRIETGAVDQLAIGIEGFEQSRCPGGSPKGDRDGRGRLREGGADRNRLRRHGAGDPLVAAGQVGEEHQHALPFRLLGLTGEGEHDCLFLPIAGHGWHCRRPAGALLSRSPRRLVRQTRRRRPRAAATGVVGTRRRSCFRHVEARHRARG